MIERTWYYYKETIQEGPIAESALRSLIANSKLPNDVLVYCSEISQDWHLASDIDVFQNLGKSTDQIAEVQNTVRPKTQRIDQPNEADQATQSFLSTFPRPKGNRQAATRHPIPPVQQPLANSVPAQQPHSPAPQPVQTKKDDDSAVGCGFLLAMISFVPYLNFLMVFASIFVFWGCCKHVAKGEFKKAWDGLIGLLMVYVFCFVVAKVLHKIFSP